jgi:hypothetical protein
MMWRVSVSAADIPHSFFQRESFRRALLSALSFDRAIVAMADREIARFGARIE